MQDKGKNKNRNIETYCVDFKYPPWRCLLKIVVPSSSLKPQEIARFVAVCTGTKDNCTDDEC